MKVAVLGTGPAGLMAAHAAVLSGAEVRIFSRRRKSELYGCQYLHAPIPGMTDVAPVEVQYVLHGDVDSYRRKVYGDGWQENVSPEDLIGNHMAWDIRRTYDNLWLQYRDLVYPTELSAEWLGGFTKEGYVDLVINSIPRPALCRRVHRFDSQLVWALGDAPERGVFAPAWASRNQVICNGLDEPRWYRAANVFGYSTVEWPDGPDHKGSQVLKPLSHDCDCWPQVTHVGRYGSWEKGMLSHTAYQTVMDMLVTEHVS